MEIFVFEAIAGASKYRPTEMRIYQRWLSWTSSLAAKRLQGQPYIWNHSTTPHRIALS